MAQINNLKHLKARRKELRNNLTPAEAALWTLLKSKQLDGRKFRRQHSGGNYILDFYCPAERLVVELDGRHHFTEEGARYDAVRTAYLANVNIHVVRFENRLVFEMPGWVLEEIRRNFRSITTPSRHSRDTRPMR